MERPRPENIALGVIAGAIAGYELLCPPGSTISEKFDPLLEGKYRHLVTLAVGVTALHILNRLPTQVDPFEQGLSRIRQRALRARGH